MQLYFIKANYTNNVYQISDFFTNHQYKTPVNKMLDINFKPDDGATSFITNKITLPDTTTINNYTHFIVPAYNKIYRIISVGYLNKEQWRVYAEEDPFLSNYQKLKTTRIIVNRTNDYTQFAGINDISNVAVKRDVTTKMIPSRSNTGKWLLIFMQYNEDKEKYGFKFDKSISSMGPNVNNTNGLELFSSLNEVKTKYREITTTTPNAYHYFQKYVYVNDLNLQTKTKYHCLYNGQKLYWSKIVDELPDGDYYYDLKDYQVTKINSSDINNLIFALPFNNNIKMNNRSTKLISAESFIGTLDPGEVLDIKLMDDLTLPFKTILVGNPNGVVETTIDSGDILDMETAGQCFSVPLKKSDGKNSDREILMISDFRKEIDLKYGFYDIKPTYAEPFRHYRLFVYGQEFSIPFVLIDKVKLLIAPNSGVINYLIYTENKDVANNIVNKNVIGSGSFTHSVKWQVDKLDEFYNQNPTYKEQYFANMIAKGIKNVIVGTAGGAIAGSVVPVVGTAVGAATGFATSVLSSGMDAAIGINNFQLEEKGKALMPDQIKGDNADLAIQLADRFGIYWKVLEVAFPNNLIMNNEYALKGFPTILNTTINALTKATNTVINVPCKVIYGELKLVIRNDYVTRFINKKLSEGVIIID